MYPTGSSFMADGRIEEDGKPEEVFNNPKKERTKEFLARYLRKEIKCSPFWPMNTRL